MNASALFCQKPGLVDQWIYSGRTGDIAIKMTIKALQDQRCKMVKAADMTLQDRNNIDRHHPLSGTGTLPCWGLVPSLEDRYGKNVYNTIETG